MLRRTSSTLRRGGGNLRARLRSTASLSLSRLAQQCRVQFQAKDAAQTQLEVLPVLQAEDFSLSVDGADVLSLFSVEEDVDDATDVIKTLRVTKKSSVDATVQLRLPHSVDLSVAVASGGVSLQDKLEGDVHVAVGRGDVAVHKLRGRSVSLKTNGGRVRVAALVEGETVRLEASDSISCKRLMAGKADVKLGKGAAPAESDFGAIYAATCNVVSTNQSGDAALHVGNVHGYLRVTSDGLRRVQVDSVTGALEVEDSGAKCDVVAHFDSWASDARSSILVAGDVRVSLQPATPIEVELHGTKVTLGEGCEFASSEMDQLDDDYAVFTGELRAQDGAMAVASASTGKINTDSAKDDAMRTSFFMKERPVGESEEVTSPKLFVHALSGEVTLDQLSWMDNIKRKHLKQ
ncbi:uncharacterized protein IUM83_14477 [Phytophthora cinnamomi]|uniref:uncharacterized protein n=1 Tax=Phytophthora cinnamomi TaxID=4785 RepID=UPI00355A258D|nr:hypothetical protein IUM83_14477 [Phytophthora cinnamomi]